MMFCSTFRASRRVCNPWGLVGAAFILCLLIALPAQAADGDLAWARAISGSSLEEPHGMCTDDNGYVYTTGTFAGTVDFDPGAGTLPLSSAGFGDIYLQKLDRDGNLLWAIALGASGSGDYGMAVAVDSAGMVYLTGFFGTTVDFDPGPGTHELTSLGSSDIFVLKLDSAGNFLWAYAAGAGNSDQSQAIAVDEAGHVYAGGYFRDTVDFDPTAGVLQQTASGSTDGYVVKLDADGTVLWAEALGTSGGDIIKSLAVDTTGNVFAGGISSSTALLQKLDSAGNPLATYSYGGTEATGLAVDSAGNLYVTGYFSGTQDFDPGPGTANLTAPGIADAYALKLDSSGNYVWSFGLNSTSIGQGTGIALDGAGNVVLAGLINGSGDFDPSGATATRASAGANDAFVAKYTSGGGFLWAGLFGGTSSELAYAVAADAQGNAMATGVYQGSGDFDPGPGTETLSNAGSSDAFIVKLQGPADTTAPTAHTIIPATTGPTNAGSIAFNLKFNEAVQNFDSMADLVIAHSGTANAGATITGGPRVYTVTVTGITGDGSFTLAASTASGLIDLAGNPLAASVTSAPITIDNTGPAATSIVPTTTGPANADSVDFTITFDGPALNFNDASDVVLTHSGTASTGVTLSGGPTVYTATVTGITGDGSFTLAVNTASDVQDSVGNPLTASVTSATVTIDNTAPGATLSTAAPSLVNAGIGVTIVLTEPTANFESGDWTLTNAAASALTGTGDTYTLTLDPLADGPFSISLPAGVFTDAAGNPNTASNTLGSEFDGTDPEFTALLVAPNTASPGTEVHLTFDASEPLWSAPGVTVNGNPADESTAKAGPSYAFTYTVQATDPPGPAVIEISGFDTAGNIGSLSSTAALTILPNDPELPLGGAAAAALLLGLLGLRATRRR